MARYADIVAVRDALYEADAITMKGVRILNQFPTLSPDEVRGVGCAYCKEDRDGYTMPLEKNAHACVQYPNKLVIQFGKEIRKCEIKYCPMCGAKMEVSEDA